MSTSIVTRSRNARRPGRGIVTGFVLLLLAVSGVRAQDTLRLRWGLFGGYSLNMHTADFRALPGVPNCCPQFRSGSGGGFLAGALAEFPLASSVLFGLRASWVMHNAPLTEQEPVTVIVNGTARDGAFEHRVDATIASIGLEPSIGVRLFGGAFASVGVRGALYVTSSYEQEERIVDPADAGTYLDANGADTRSRVRNTSAGDLPNASTLLLQATAGVAWELPMNADRTLFLVPEISYAMSLTDVVTDVEWKANGLRMGVALKLSPAPAPPKPVRYDTVIVRDTTTRPAGGITAPRFTLLRTSSSDDRMEGPDTIVVRETVRESYLKETPIPPPMTCTLNAVGVDANGNESPIATLRIEEFLSTIAHPLLSYIFFDPGSSELAGRYTRLAPDRVAGFRPEDLFGSGTLPVYYTMLNVIGHRMRNNPRATLTLTGCNMDQEEEKGNLELSRRRAEAVRDYLTGVWGIDAGRLRVEARGLPEKRSNPLTPDGQAENRRVEISSNVPEILDVLIVSDTTRTSNPPLVRLVPTITSPRGIESWEMTIAQRGVVLERMSGSGPVPAGVDWDPDDDPATVPRYDAPLTITLNATAADGERVTCSLELPTEVMTVRKKREMNVQDYTIDRYNLILFNVGESGINAANQRVIDLIKGRLKPSSVLTIEGFADRTGNAPSNQRLSENRAKMTAETLGRPDATIRGIGEARLLHPNDNPEGRFYCRTVQIEVKTPMR